MKNTIPTKILILFFGSFGLTGLAAQVNDYENEETYADPYQESRTGRLSSFSDHLHLAMDYFRDEDEAARSARLQLKMDEGLHAFLETPFVEKYKELRLEVESLAASFKAYSGELRPEEVIKVKNAYGRIADEFNLLLTAIKRDFLDHKKLKHIRRYPDMYSAALELRLRELQDRYAQDFQNLVADIIGIDKYSAAPLRALLDVIKLAVDLTNHLSRLSYENRKIKEEHLDQHFITPYRMRDWEELEVISVDVHNGEPERF